MQRYLARTDNNTQFGPSVRRGHNDIFEIYYMIFTRCNTTNLIINPPGHQHEFTVLYFYCFHLFDDPTIWKTMLLIMDHACENGIYLHRQKYIVYTSFSFNHYKLSNTNHEGLLFCDNNWYLNRQIDTVWLSIHQQSLCTLILVHLFIEQLCWLLDKGFTWRVLGVNYCFLSSSDPDKTSYVMSEINSALIKRVSE